MNKKKIAIVGFGRFGQLLAKILEPYGDLFIVVPKKIDQGFKQICYPDLQEMDWVIPAVPISALEEVLIKIGPLLKRGSLVMDVCSVKVLPCRWLKKYIPKQVEILGTHPMFGPDSAKNGLKGLQMVICPLRQSRNTLNEVKDLFKKMDLKIIETTPEEHDRQAALNLALVHYVGRGLSKMKAEKQTITTLGYERLLAINETVNNDTWQLFFDMQRYNPYAKRSRQKFRYALESLEDQIDKI